VEHGASLREVPEMLDFILNPKNLPLFGCVLILGTPLLAGVLLLMGLRRGRKLSRSPFFWVAAASGPAVAVLWFVFNGILALLGFDSIFSFLANILIFCGIGMSIGAYLRYSYARSRVASVGRGKRRDDVGKAKAE
jgi:hypothetical protein